MLKNEGVCDLRVLFVVYMKGKQIHTMVLKKYCGGSNESKLNLPGLLYRMDVDLIKVQLGICY